MRLKKEYIEYIRKNVKQYFGKNAKVFLFGSRVDDSKKGGDIDLYIETDLKKELIDRKLKMLANLHKEFGEQKIDIIVNNFVKEKYIFQIAKEKGILL